MTVQILVGDARERMREMQDESVQCVVTSPPYWGLRDYGVAGQMGLERTPEEYVAALVAVFREVRRVLRNDGTLWLNLGDTYQNAKGQAGGIDPKQPARRHGLRPQDISIAGLKPKDLVGIPWMVAFALRLDGWYLRQDIIWAKTNAMPESVRDRCTKAHEYIFLLSKSRRYYFDHVAILEPMAASSERRLAQNIAAQNGSVRVPGKTNGPMKAVSRAKGNAKTFRGGGSYTGGRSFDNSLKVERASHGNAPNETGLRNKRSVWSVASKGFKKAHFATFPPALIVPCILAGCPIGGTILDPFAGAGTVGLVASRLGRDAILIDLNPTYTAMAQERIDADKSQGELALTP
jgi:DNA modification methylase